MRQIERQARRSRRVTHHQGQRDHDVRAAPPVYPLTGVPIDRPGLAQHPAVVVKMDNSPDARPQTGINEADVVYELLVEGITRYAVVFQSQTPDPVGPVRSARSSDIELLTNLGAPLIAWSGANPGVTNEVHTAVENGFLVNAGQDTIPAQYHRDNSRKAPHNLYTNVSGLLADAAPAGAGAPPPLFTYRAPFEPYTGGALPAPGYVVDFGGGVRADYVWDAERAGWDRFQVDELHPRPRPITSNDVNEYLRARDRHGHHREGVPHVDGDAARRVRVVPAPDSRIRPRGAARGDRRSRP